jgi:hypothetical protein
MNNPANILAITKAIKEKLAKEARADLSPGIHPVDVTAHIKGILDVKEDETFTPTVNIPIKSAFALFIRYCGVTREAAKNAAIRAMTDSLNNGHDSDGALNAETSDEARIIADCEAQVTEMLGKLPTQVRKGKVLTKLELEIVQP